MKIKDEPAQWNAERIAVLDQAIAEEKDRLRELRNLKKNTDDEYIDKLLANVRAYINTLRDQKNRVARPNPKTTARVLKIAGVLNTNLRGHLLKGTDPAVLLLVAEQVNAVMITGPSRNAVNQRSDRKVAKESANKLIEEWNSGKYATKEKCAEEAGVKKLKMSFVTAKGALRNKQKTKTQK